MQGMWPRAALLTALPGLPPSTSTGCASTPAAMASLIWCGLSWSATSSAHAELLAWT